MQSSTNAWGRPQGPLDLDRIHTLSPHETTGAHPVSALAADIARFFGNLGFSQVHSPEIEDTFHNFDLLGVPADHPTRSPRHTFFLENEGLLRSHATASVLRVLRRHPAQSVARVLVGGPCHRNTTPGPRFVTQFHQLEAAAVGPAVRLSDVKGMALALVDETLGPAAHPRLRYRSLPYVSPGLAVDVNCIPCDGSGCKFCGYRGYVEVMSGGVLTQEVRKAALIPPESRAISLAISLERILALRYGVADIRPFLSADLRLLSQTY